MDLLVVVVDVLAVNLFDDFKICDRAFEVALNAVDSVASFEAGGLALHSSAVVYLLFVYLSGRVRHGVDLEVLFAVPLGLDPEPSPLSQLPGLQGFEVVELGFVLASVHFELVGAWPCAV